MSEDLRDARRVYYDHEPAYRKIRDVGGEGWDDLPQPENSIKDEAFGSYVSLESFLDSEWAPEPTTALELGCGGGQACFILEDAGYEPFGVDYSETAIELARDNARRTGRESRFARADVTRLDDFEDASFGLVVDNHCLHCLVEPADRLAMLRQARRVLRSDGVFFTSTMSCEGDFDPEVMGVDPTTRISIHRTRFWVSEKELHSELENAGLRLLELRREAQEPGTGDLLNVVATPMS